MRYRRFELQVRKYTSEHGMQWVASVEYQVFDDGIIKKAVAGKSMWVHVACLPVPSCKQRLVEIHR